MAGNLLSRILKVGGAGLMGFANPIGAISGALSGAGEGQGAERTNQNAFQQNQNSQQASLYGTQQNALLSALLAQERGATDRYGTQQAATTNATQGRQSATSHALDAQSAEGMNRSRLGMESGSVRARQSVMGSLMKNLQPTSIQSAPGQRGHETKITGGLSASALDPTTRQHGDELMKSALMAQLSGSDVPEATDFKSGVQDWDSSVLAPPAATDFQSGLIKPPTLDGYQEPGKLETGLSGAGTIGAIIAALMKQGQTPQQNYPIDLQGGG